MPDHLHALITGTCDDGRAAKAVRAVKQRTSFYFKKSFGLRLWQRSYFDRTLRTRDDARATIAYIVSNPIRAGLAASASDYPHWGSQRYRREEILEFLQIRPT
jgi:REP element-mobilizing transposase RayT